MQSKILISVAVILSIFFNSCSSGERDNPVDPQGSNFSLGFNIGEISGNTSELGDTATFTVKLGYQPTADVVIPISSSNTNEGTVTSESLTFTPLNWNASQVVTVTGVDDSLADGYVEYSIVLAPAFSDDFNYNGLDPDDVSLSNTDNETGGFTVGGISGNTSENFTTATFTVKLNSRPYDDVIIPISSNDSSEGTVSPASVTFTPENWDTSQIITVTGVDDSLADGDQEYLVVLGAASSEDSEYYGLDPDDVTVLNVDNDSPGFEVILFFPDTREDGSQTEFAVRLYSQPSAEVTVPVSSGDPSEGSVNPDTLIFTPSNWKAFQMVTVTGVDDFDVDGDQDYIIILEAATSGDSDYNGLSPTPAGVSLINIDDETAGFTISAISGNTTESGGTATFTVRLNSKPTDSVHILLIDSDDDTEGMPSPESVFFTPENWDANQIITVTGVNDDLADGNKSYNINLSDATSDDGGYDGLSPIPAGVSVTNVDDETAGFTISAISGDTTEGGGQARFTVRLNSQPTADVTIPVSSSDTGEGTVTPASLTFTTDNWSAGQDVMITGIDDDLADGDQSYTIILGADNTTGDLGYNDLEPTPAAVSVTNIDNDSAGFAISLISGSTTEGGTTATFNVQLTSQPTDTVTVPVSSSDDTEGTVSTTSLTFTTDDWDAASHIITVTGVNDKIADGDQSYNILLGAATSSDADYGGLKPSDVAAINIDNDSAGFIISLISGNTTEGGGTAAFNVQLTSQPTDTVTVPVSSNDDTEGTVSATSLTFTTDDWDAASHIITVTGVNDDIADGNRSYNIILGAATSGDANYDGLKPSDVAVKNTDDDSAGFTVSPVSGSTTEGGGTATFYVQLTSQPTNTVTIPVSSSDETEGTVSAPSLIFTTDDWNAVSHIITVTGVDDDLADGEQGYNIILGAATGSDSKYRGKDPDNVAVTNTDDETAGFTISAITGDTDENGTQAEFTVRLNSKPEYDVTVPVSSSDTDEGTVDKTLLVFTNLNWDIDQTVTVTGENDYLADGTQAYSIILGTTESASLPYDNLDPSGVPVWNIDNDSPGFIVSSISGKTTEGGGQATFTVTLTSEPTDDVIISITSSNVKEGTVSDLTMTLDSANWNSAGNTITVTGVNDDIADGDQNYSILLGIASSGDSNYNSLDPSDVLVTNSDNDSPGFFVSTISGDTTEDGETASFYVNLTSEPTDEVTISVESGNTDEGTVSTSSIILNSTNWNLNDASTTVIVSGVNDDSIDENVEYDIILGAAISGDSNYDTLDPSDVSVTNIDNDSAGFFISPISGPTTEDGGTASFYINLTSEPTADVTISVSSSSDEGTVSTSSIILNSTNWNLNETSTTVTVTGADDFDSDGNLTYTIILGAATSPDLNYDTLDPSDVAVTNIDDETPSFIVSAISGNTSEDGTTATFTVRLSTVPDGNVVIQVASDNESEGTVDRSYLIFTDNDWNIDQQVTVYGEDDLFIDGNQPYTVTLALDTLNTLDTTGYVSLDPDDVSVTNDDND